MADLASKSADWETEYSLLSLLKIKWERETLLLQYFTLIKATEG